MPTPQRISLIEAYDNRDVVAWLVRHSTEIDDLKTAVDALPESDEFVLTIGDQTINGTKSFVNKIAAAGGIEADTLVKINADLQVFGDIYQNGSAYDTHAEQLYTTKDYILMRDGAAVGLAPGAMSGLEVIKYDGTNNLRLAADASGVARIGDVGDEQPLLTRAESADLADGDPLCWDSTDQKAVPFTIAAGQNITITPGTHGIEISASGGGSGEAWTLHTATNWNDIMTFSNGSFTILKDVKVYNTAYGTLLFDLVKGSVIPSNMLYGPFFDIGVNNSILYVFQAVIEAANITDTRIRSYENKISYTTDGSTVTLVKTQSFSWINKSALIVWVKQ